jgi:hypothetical protein
VQARQRMQPIRLAFTRTSKYRHLTVRLCHCLPAGVGRRHFRG